MNKNSRFYKLSVIFGLLLIFISVIYVRYNNVSGYELNIYAGTPTIFWVAIFSGLTISATVSFIKDTKILYSSSILLGYLSFSTLLLLPIIRGYYFMGEGDSLTHLAWIQEISYGTISALELRYPLSHVLTVVLDYFFYQTTTAALFTVFLFALSFSVFVTLCVRIITTSGFGTYFAIFSSFLLLPITHVSGHLLYYPTTHAVLYFPLLLFSFLHTYYNSTRRSFLILLILIISFILLHPQQAASLMLFFVVLSVLLHLSQNIAHFGISKTITNILKNRSILATIVFIIIFWLWVNQIPEFESALNRFILHLLAETPTAGQVSQTGVSLTQRGSSLIEIFAKLFSASLIYCILTIFVVFHGVRNIMSETSSSVCGQATTLSLYMTLSTFPVFILFVGYVFAGESRFYFRYFILLMSIFTIIGSVGLWCLYMCSRERYSKSILNRTFIIVVVLLLITFPIVYPSPYIELDSRHVSEGMVEGHKTTFEFVNEEHEFVDVRSSTYRYGQKLIGTKTKERRDYYGGERSQDVPNNFADRQISNYYDEPVYLTLTESDKRREVSLYNGFLFSENSFLHLDNDNSISKIHSNGEFDLYYIL